MKKIENSYKKSGVNIPLANKLVSYISNLSKKNCPPAIRTISILLLLDSFTRRIAVVEGVIPKW